MRGHRRCPRAIAFVAAIVGWASFGGAACAKLVFLKPPSVPRPAGLSDTRTGPAFAPAADSSDPHATAGDADWQGYNNTLAGDRFSPLREITPANVASLRPRCTFRLGERAAMESGPVVIGGTLYVTSARRTYAIDAATCTLRWRHTYQYTPSPPFDLKV